MLDLSLLRTFLAVAGTLSFRRAAQDLHLAPSTVSVQVKALEEDLGQALFERTGRRVLLTEAGLRLVDQAPRLLALEGEVRRALSGDGEGEESLSVRLSETLGLACLPGILARFREGHPHARLAFATSSALGLARDLRQGRADLALILGQPFAAPGLSVDILGREPLVLAVPPDSDLAGRAFAGPGDLDGRPLALTPHVWGLRQELEGALLTAGAVPQSLTECGSAVLALALVRAGLAVSVVPGFSAAGEARTGGLALLEWSPGPLLAPVLLLRRAGRPMSPAAEAFARAARDHFSRR
jgi:DNA-binding transcriptional LysR family regulator